MNDARLCSEKLFEVTDQIIQENIQKGSLKKGGSKNEHN